MSLIVSWRDRKATAGWTDNFFLVAGVPGQLVQLRLNSATCLDLALCNTVLTDDGISGGSVGGRTGPFTDSLDPL